MAERSIMMPWRLQCPVALEDSSPGSSIRADLNMEDDILK
jgi:hypothetical protein